MVSPAPGDRRTGHAAVAAGLLLAVPVGVELVWQVQRPDGSVTHVAGFGLYVGAFLAGAVALAVALHGSGRGAAGLPRSGRIGRAVTLSGAWSLTAFAAVLLVTGLFSGRPLDTAFWLFLVGFLLLAGGSVPLALGLHRSGARGRVWGAVLAGGAGALVAILSESPTHEVGLLLFGGAWVFLGLDFLQHARRPAVVGTSVGRAGRSSRRVG